ncbi:acyl carrier protein [Candidatus Woesearchaeota archaeon]|nr:acyl carrier protein [Candidatus Woesearchaeota archaeon]
MDSLKQIVSRVLNIDSINENVSRNNTEEWDSFNHLLLISEIEKELKVKFTMLEVEQIKTFKELQEVVSKKRK